MRIVCWRCDGFWTLAIMLAVAQAGCSEHFRDTAITDSYARDATTAEPIEPTWLHGVRIEALGKPIRWGFLFYKGYEADPPTIERARACTPLVIDELKRYPAVFFDRLKLKRVVLCGSIRIDGREMSGFAGTLWDTIYLSTRDWGTPSEKEHFAVTVHHELMHMLDAQDGRGYDAEWKALNPRGFRYGTTSREETCACSGRGGDGFVAADGKRSSGEDKAHTFSYLVTQYAAVRDLGRRDPIVQAKADLIERIVAAFCPEVGTAFWAKAQYRSESPEARLAAAVRYGWVDIQPGVDPLDPDRPPAQHAAIVRRTRFPGSQRYTGAAGRVTRLSIPWRDLVFSLYKTPAPRCLVPRELETSHFDMIVSVPNAPDSFGPLARWVTRDAFETEFGVTLKAETRETDVYVLRTDARGTKRLEAAARRCEREQSTPKMRDAWDRFLTGRPAESQLEISAGADWRDGRMYFSIHNAPLPFGLEVLEMNGLDRPVIDETGFQKPLNVTVPYEPEELHNLLSLANALGLEVVSARRSVTMAVAVPREPETRPKQ